MVSTSFFEIALDPPRLSESTFLIDVLMCSRSDSTSLYGLGPVGAGASREMVSSIDAPNERRAGAASGTCAPASPCGRPRPTTTGQPTDTPRRTVASITPGESEASLNVFSCWSCYT
eukprot:scaffold29995_cov101-Isochrysis_galbana.AAC.1